MVQRWLTTEEARASKASKNIIRSRGFLALLTMHVLQPRVSRSGLSLLGEQGGLSMQQEAYAKALL